MALCGVISVMILFYSELLHEGTRRGKVEVRVVRAPNCCNTGTLSWVQYERHRAGTGFVVSELL